jgi:P pilus assembly chaperone PapD
MKNNCKALFFLAALLLPFSARAEFSLSSMVIDFAGGAPRQQDIELHSSDADTLYLDTEVFEIKNPGTPQEERVKLDKPEEAGLIVSPRRTVLQPGANKNMRFIVVNTPKDTDKIFRVTVKPLVSGISARSKVALKVMIGYDAMVVVRPEKTTVDLTGQRNGTQLTLTNKGNTSMLLQNGSQCLSTADCKPLDVVRVYAGQTWSTTLPDATLPASYQVWDGTKTQEYKF